MARRESLGSFPQPKIERVICHGAAATPRERIGRQHSTEVRPPKVFGAGFPLGTGRRKSGTTYSAWQRVEERHEPIG
jgi:hypothetical protein